MCCIFSSFHKASLFLKIWVLCWGGEKQELGKKYPQCVTQSGGGLNAMDRELHWGQPSCRWREHSKFCSQSHPPASPLCSTPVCYNLTAWSSAIRNGGLSLHEAVLLPFSSLPKRFSSGLSKKPRWQPANGLADCSSTFQEFGEEEFHFQRPLELNLASRAKRCSSRWNCLWMVPNRAASCQGLESSFPWTLKGLFLSARFWRTEKRGY